MPKTGSDPTSRLLAILVEREATPNVAVVDLLKANTGITSQELHLILLESALRLEEMYDQLWGGEWTDWQRVDYWLRVSSDVRGGLEGGPGLLKVTFDHYRTFALVLADVAYLQHKGLGKVTGADLLSLWKERQSGFFPVAGD